jgi:hypothetical protein
MALTGDFQFGFPEGFPSGPFTVEFGRLGPISVSFVIRNPVAER